MSSCSVTCNACGMICKKTENLRVHIKTCVSAISMNAEATKSHETQLTREDSTHSESASVSFSTIYETSCLDTNYIGEDSNSLEVDSPFNLGTTSELNDSRLPYEIDPLCLFQDLDYNIHKNRLLFEEDFASDRGIDVHNEEELIWGEVSSKNTSVYTGTSSIVTRGRLSLSGMPNPYIRETFSEGTGKHAGRPLLDETGNISPELPQDHFESNFDISFAYWLYRENISSNAIRRLLEQPNLEPLHDMLSWKSAKQLRKNILGLRTGGSEIAGKWYKREFELRSTRAVSGKTKYILRYRTVEDAIRFFLGHASFRDDLLFEPYRLWTADEPRRRIYSDMASADWWWDLQTRIKVEGATIVPLIIASDKTQVTNHQGDLAAHAVYLTIGNLPAHIRNSNERPGTVLLAMLPIVKGSDATLRRQLFHECLRVLFDPIMDITRNGGIKVSCADGGIRECFPVIAAMALDYEEQVHVTGVKSGVHCTMCQVKPNDREDLEGQWPWRTHRDTQRQHYKQRESNTKKTEDTWIHDVDCFAFGHQYVNIHKTMMVDILHQLLKGVLSHVLEWTQALLIDQMPAKHTARITAALLPDPNRPSKRRKYTASKSIVQDIIDRRFAVIPAFSKIRVFTQISSVQQWTGKEQKSLLRQILPALTPLLEEIGAYEAIRFVRAVVDFILLAMYKRHDASTLESMTSALFRMNVYKEVFRPYRKTHKTTTGEDDEEGHFNFPKFHAMTHYVEMIKLLGNAPDLETGHFEHKHVDFIKTPFKLTNKRMGWEDQVMDAYQRKLNILARFDNGLYTATQKSMEKGIRSERPIVPTANPVDIHNFFGWPRRRVRGERYGHDTWRTVEEVEILLGHSLGTCFKRAVARFIRESRGNVDNRALPLPRDTSATEDNDSWVNGYYVQFHSGIRCWKRTGQDLNNSEDFEQDIVRCAPRWQGINGNGRYDWLWVQEHHFIQGLRTDENTNMPFGGRLPAQLRFVVSVRDNGRPVNDIDGYQIESPRTRRRQLMYTGAFVELYRPKVATGRANKDHGMTVITPMSKDPSEDKLQGWRVYPLTNIYNSIHVVPVDENNQRGDMYINNTADFETYNMLWDPEWEADVAAAARISREERIRERKQRQPLKDGGEH